MEYKRVVVATLIIVTMLLAILPATSPHQGNNTVAAQSTASTCPSRAFRMTLIAPPSSLNMLTMITGGSSAPMIFMQYMSTIGPVSISGQVDTTFQLTDVITHNANYTVWMFHVKPGLLWSDGTPVTAADILATFGPNFAFNTTYDFANLHVEVKSQYAQNTSTAVYVLNAPDAQWPQKIKGDYFTTVMPASLINQYGAGAANFGTTKSVGPFYMENYSAGQFQAKMVRNPYFNSTGLPEPNICEVDVNFVDSLSQTAAYLQTGSTDFAFVEYSNAKATVAANPNIHLYDEKGLGITDIQYNDTAYPYNMTAFRQGLAYSVNQSQIVSQAFAGYGLTAYGGEGAVSPVATNYYNPNVANYSFNPTTAQGLFAQAGITKGANGKMQYPNGTAVTLTLWADTDNTADPQAAAVVQTDLQNLGFTVNLQTTTGANIVGDYGANAQGIRSSMILATTNVAYFGEPYIDTLPGWDVYFLPTVPANHWLWPASADAMYNSNASAYSATADPTQDKQYLFNIEALNAQYLPSLVVAYPDKLFAVNEQYWTNFPPGELVYYSYNWNITGLVNIQPAGTNTATSSTLPPPTTGGTTTSQISTNTNTGSITTPQTVTTTTAAATTTTGSNTTLLIGVGVVIVIIIIAAAALAMRRKK
ncbi:MAG: ABC transporter substrate-binding protein [Nitrososphaerales archaeon]